MQRPVLPGVLWDFNTNNEPPEVDAGDDQYLWLNNAGDPATATVDLAGQVDDDGLPVDQLSVLWTQTAGPADIIDPNGVVYGEGPYWDRLADTEEISLVLPALGSYQFRLTANDTDQEGFDIVQVVVAADPCLAAQAMPGYTFYTGDLNEDCLVDLRDLALMAADWLGCNSLVCP